MVDVYKASWILPIEKPPIEQGALAVRDGHILAVGPAADVLAAVRANGVDEPRVHDLGDHVLLPGFVNPHTHLELSCYRGRLSPGPLWTWFHQLLGMRTAPGALEHEKLAVVTGADESLAAGVTCLGDISRQGVHLRGLKNHPIRAVCFFELISGAYVPPSDVPSLKNVVEQARTHTEPDRLMIGVSPHTPYTVSESDLRELAPWIQSSRLPCTMHLLETIEEQQWLATGEGPMDELLRGFKLPTAGWRTTAETGAYLRDTKILSARPALAHVNYVDDACLDVLAAHDVSIVWCPRSHAFFGHSQHRWQEMLRRGLNVCIGTDSLASNEGLSILDELRWVRRRHPIVSSRLLLEMGTIRGARALGLADRLGSLMEGKLADFVSMPYKEACTAGGLPDRLLRGESKVDGVWIGGVPVGREGLQADR